MPPATPTTTPLQKKFSDPAYVAKVARQQQRKRQAARNRMTAAAKRKASSTPQPGLGSLVDEFKSSTYNQ